MFRRSSHDSNDLKTEFFQNRGSSTASERQARKTRLISEINTAIERSPGDALLINLKAEVEKLNPTHITGTFGSALGIDYFSKQMAKKEKKFREITQPAEQPHRPSGGYGTF